MPASTTSYPGMETLKLFSVMWVLTPRYKQREKKKRLPIFDDFGVTTESERVGATEILTRDHRRVRLMC